MTSGRLKISDRVREINTGRGRHSNGTPGARVRRGHVGRAASDAMGRRLAGDDLVQLHARGAAQPGRTGLPAVNLPRGKGSL